MLQYAFIDVFLFPHSGKLLRAATRLVRVIKYNPTILECVKFNLCSSVAVIGGA